MVAVKPGSAKKGAKNKMTLKCKNCKMNSKCICIPDSDECILRWETYKMIKRQAHSEAIKNLIELPCKIGDTVYIVTPKSKKVTAYKITGYSSGYGKGFIPVPEVLTEKQDKNEIVFYFSNKTGNITGSCTRKSIGKSVYLTKEQAEEELKKTNEYINKIVGENENGK